MTSTFASSSSLRSMPDDSDTQVSIDVLWDELSATREIIAAQTTIIGILLKAMEAHEKMINKLIALENNRRGRG